jgi:hypothetical protein
MALSKDRLATKERNGVDFVYPVAAATKIYAGALVMLDGGYAKPGAVATGKVAVGRAEEQVDNSGGSNGDVTVRVKRGVFLFNNSAASDAIALSDVGANCYIVDDETVAKTNGTNTRSVAGKIEDVSAEGVWVRI